MMFDAEDRQDMLEGVGVLAEVTVGGETFWVKSPPFPDAREVFNGIDMESINPVGVAAKEDLARLNIVAGESGTLITLTERDYRVLSIEHESSGFCNIELGVV